MPESVYKVIELVGTSTESWERAAAAAVKRAAKTLRDLRVAEISQLDMQLKDGKVESYREGEGVVQVRRGLVTWSLRCFLSHSLQSWGPLPSRSSRSLVCGPLVTNHHRPTSLR